MSPLGMHAGRGAQHQNYPQGAARAGADANAGDEPARAGQPESSPGTGLPQIDDGAERMLQGEEPLVRDSREIEYHTRTRRRGGEVDRVEPRARGSYRRGRHDRRADAEQNDGPNLKDLFYH